MEQGFVPQHLLSGDPVALSDVTREAIIDRLEEYRKSPEAFHARWGGSDKNVDYHIIWEGGFYPSKAIVNAAHYVVMGDPNMKGRGYSGGLATMIPVLERHGFDYTEGKVNWDREEMILALELYFRSPQPGKHSTAVAEVSDLLRKRAVQLGRIIPPRFRNGDGVYLKMMNFRRYDAAQIAKGNKGMDRGARLEEAVWSEWSGKKNQLKDAAAAIRLSIESGIEVGEAFSDDLDADLAAEGGFEYRQHRRYERNPQNVRRKKAAVRNAGLPLECEACGFDFEKAYGPRGADYIEVHHKKPVHTLKEGTVLKLSDLALLCSNCHRMAHRWGKLMAVDEVAALRKQAS
jgi:5-methylcytosine-specific restriction protein A